MKPFLSSIAIKNYEKSGSAHFISHFHYQFHKISLLFSFYCLCTLISIFDAPCFISLSSHLMIHPRGCWIMSLFLIRLLCLWSRCWRWRWFFLILFLMLLKRNHNSLVICLCLFLCDGRNEKKNYPCLFKYQTSGWWIEQHFMVYLINNHQSSAFHSISLHRISSLLITKWFNFFSILLLFLG